METERLLELLDRAKFAWSFFVQHCGLPPPVNTIPIPSPLTGHRLSWSYTLCQHTNLSSCCTKLSSLQGVRPICTHLPSYRTKLSSLQVVGLICTFLLSCVVDTIHSGKQPLNNPPAGAHEGKKVHQITIVFLFFLNTNLSWYSQLSTKQLWILDPTI